MFLVHPTLEQSHIQQTIDALNTVNDFVLSSAESEDEQAKRFLGLPVENSNPLEASRRVVSEK